MTTRILCLPIWKSSKGSQRSIDVHTGSATEETIAQKDIGSASVSGLEIMKHNRYPQIRQRRVILTITKLLDSVPAFQRNCGHLPPRMVMAKSLYAPEIFMAILVADILALNREHLSPMILHQTHAS
jgi:hypothetical protein